MSDRFNIAVVGATTLVGEAVLSLLAERDLPLGEVFALDVAEVASGRVPYKKTHLKLQDISGFDFSNVDVAIFSAGERVSADYVPKATALGCIVIDDSSCFRLDEDVPLVVPEVNSAAVAQYKQRHIIANPNTCATLLSLVLKPIMDKVGVERVNAVSLQAVSGRDKAGVNELATQATALFNLKQIEHKVFPQQIVFNVLPQIGELLDNGYSQEEMKLLSETRKILGNPKLQINATSVRVPVFYGHAMSVHMETREKVSVEAASALLAGFPGIELRTGVDAEDCPTPVTDAPGQDLVFVGRLREDISHPKGLDLWLVADNVRKGAALNSVQIAEILIKEYLS